MEDLNSLVDRLIAEGKSDAEIQEAIRKFKGEKQKVEEAKK